MTAIYTWPREVLVYMAIINFILCSMIGWSCVCRFAKMSRETTRMGWRFRYVFVMVGATASGFSFVWGEQIGPGQLLMTCGYLYILGLSAKGWKQGIPLYARKPETLSREQRNLLNIESP